LGSDFRRNDDKVEKRSAIPFYCCDSAELRRLNSKPLLRKTTKPPRFERRFRNQDKPFEYGRKAMSRHVMLVIAAAVALIAVTSRPTVKLEQTAFLPTPDIQWSDDPNTVAFINIYLRHGSQFDTRQNAK
jgi:cytochrome c-type biogenesis protein CcmH/NrfG